MNIKKNRGYKAVIAGVLILCSFTGEVYAQDNTMYPISYNHIYVHIRAIYEILVKSVEWDNVIQFIHAGEYGANITDYTIVRASHLLSGVGQESVYDISNLKLPLILNKNEELGNYDKLIDVYFSTYINKDGKLQYKLNIRHNNGKLVKHPRFYAVDPDTDVYALDSYINTINIYLKDGTSVYKMSEYDNYISSDDINEKVTSDDGYTKVDNDVLFYIGLETGSFHMDASEADIYPEDIDRIVFKYKNGNSFIINPREIRIE